MIEPPKPGSGQPNTAKADYANQETAPESKLDGRNDNTASPVKVVEQQFPVAPSFQMNAPYQLAPAANMGAVSKH